MPGLTDPVVLAQFHAVLAMHDFLQRREVIDQQPETRPEWSAWPFHYDFRVSLAGRDVYIETILQDDDPKDPTIHIVSIHDV